MFSAQILAYKLNLYTIYLHVCHVTFPLPTFESHFPTFLHVWLQSHNPDPRPFVRYGMKYTYLALAVCGPLKFVLI